MGLLDQLEARFLQPIIDAIKRWLGPFGKLIDFVSRFFTSFKTSFDKALQLSGKVRNEIIAWKTFKEAPPIRTGVINLPGAIEHAQDLLDEIRAAWQAIVDLAKQIEKQAKGQTEDPTAEAEEAVSELESGGGGITKLLERFPKLAKGLEKLLGFLAVLLGILESFQSAIDDLSSIVDAISDLRETIESGAGIFLQQKNPRQIVKLDDGTTMKIRLGNLH